MKLKLRRTHRKIKIAPGITQYEPRRPMESYETTAPWLIFRFAWTDWQTRFLGRSKVLYECLICGKKESIVAKIPRFGPVPEPEDGVHPKRLEVIARHQHPGKRGNPMLWAKPLGNPDALKGTDSGIVDIIEERLKP